MPILGWCVHLEKQTNKAKTSSKPGKPVISKPNGKQSQNLPRKNASNFPKLSAQPQQMQNPQQSWKQNGKPFPNLSIEQIKDIRNGSKLHQSQIFKLEQQMVVTLKLPNTPNVVLVQYCSNESSGYVLFALFPNTWDTWNDTLNWGECLILSC